MGEQKKKLAEKAARKRRVKKHLLSVMRLKAGMDAAFALESQEEQEAQLQAMRDRIDDFEAKVEFDKLAKEAEERRAESQMQAEAYSLQKQAREKKLKEEEKERRRLEAEKANKNVFGAAGGGMLAKLKHKSKITKAERRKKKHYEEVEKWNYWEDSNGVKHKKKTIQEIREDPRNMFDGYEMDCPHVSSIDLDYELDLLEFEGICERERALPVSRMRYANEHDRHWLILVRRMEFELYITMSLERKVQAAILWFIITCYCCFAIFMNLLFGMKFPPTKAKEWIDTALGTLFMGFFINEPICIVAGVALGELPALWKMLQQHHDEVDKELDAVIMVQSVWRSKIEHRKYLSVVHDNRGAKAAIEERRARELKIWNDKHDYEIKAITKLQAAWRGFVARKIYADMKRADAERRAIIRKNNRMAFQKRMQQRANMLGAMSLADRRAKEEQKRLEKEAYMAALKSNMDAARIFLMNLVKEGRMIEAESNKMVSQFGQTKPSVNSQAATDVAANSAQAMPQLSPGRKTRTRKF